MRKRILTTAIVTIPAALALLAAPATANDADVRVTGSCTAQASI